MEGMIAAVEETEAEVEADAEVVGRRGDLEIGNEKG